MTFEHTVFSPRMAIGLVISRMHRKALKTFSISPNKFCFLTKEKWWWSEQYQSAFRLWCKYLIKKTRAHLMKPKSECACYNQTLWSKRSRSSVTRKGKKWLLRNSGKWFSKLFQNVFCQAERTRSKINVQGTCLCQKLRNIPNKADF